MTTLPGCDVPANAIETPNKPKSVRSTLVSRNVTIAGHRTSVRLEPEMWSGLTEICRRERMIMHEVCTSVSMRKQQNTSLTAAIRVFVMAYFRVAATEDGHSNAGHGYGAVIIAAPVKGIGLPQATAGDGRHDGAFTVAAGGNGAARRF